MKKKVVVGLSGGIDSAMSAYLLKEKGYEVIGITMIHIDNFDIDRVKKVAETLNIQLIFYNIKEVFEKEIIKPFIEEYLKGRTPNPCIMCNPRIKFGILKKKALEYGDIFATGHYVDIVDVKGRLFIKKGKDKRKDQSYFLYRLTQKDLKETVFPLGKYIKEEVRKMQDEVLKLSPKKESQDICFIKDSYEELVRAYKKNIKEGEFITEDGKVLGIHKGIPFYTIGQRKGLGISSGQRLYVKEILPEKNKIVLSKREELIQKEFIVGDLASPSYDDTLPENNIYKVKVRYNTREKEAKIEYISSNKIKVTLLKEGEYAITPGQSAVFYEDDYLIGGGIIENITS